MTPRLWSGGIGRGGGGWRGGLGSRGGCLGWGGVREGGMNEWMNEGRGQLSGGGEGREVRTCQVPHFELVSWLHASGRIFIST